MVDTILEILKVYLGDDYSSDMDALLTVCVNRAITAYKAYRNYPSSFSDSKITADIELGAYCIADVAMFYFVKQGAEFEESRTENGTTRTWRDEKEIYTNHSVYPYITVL